MAETIDFCGRWANTTLHLPERMWWSDDQGVFNQLLTGHGSADRTGFYPVRAAGLDGRLIHGPAGLVLAPLPAENYCSGHLVWMQQDGRPEQCHAVHSTFTEFGDAGKRWRFMEAGLWGPLPTSYFAEGHYLTFEPPQPPRDPAPCGDGEGHYVAGGAPPLPCGGEDATHTLPRPKRWGDILAEEGAARSVRLRQNVELMRRQLHALRDALGIAFLLNRTLVLPHFDCLCDRSELVDYIPSCVFPGAPSRLSFPRKCSTHFVLNIHKLLYITEPSAHGLASVGGVHAPPIPLRAHSFLADTRTDAAILQSSQRVAVTGAPAPLERSPRCSAPRDRKCQQPLADTAARAAVIARSDVQRVRVPVATDGRDDSSEGDDASRVVLRRGATNVDVLRTLGTPEMRSKRLLRLSDAEGVLGGWETDRAHGMVFQTLEQYFLLGGDWCCTSRRANDGRLYPVDPPRLRLG